MKRSERIFKLMLLAWSAGILFFFQKVAWLDPLFSFLLSVLWLGFFSLSAFGWGAWTWRLIFGKSSLQGMGFLLAPVLGVVILMAGAAVLGALSLLYPFPLLVIMSGGCIAGVFFLWRHPLPWNWGHPPRIPFVTLFGLAGWAILIASIPSGFYDQFHYHLAFPFQWLQAGRLVAFPRHAYSYFPSNMGFLYTYGLSFLGMPGAQLLHGWMAAYSVLMIGTATAMYRNRASGWWAATFFAITPAVILSSTWAAADLGVVFAALAGWVFLSWSWKQRDTAGNGWLAWFLAGIVAGVGVGCKILALATVGIPLFIGLLLLPHESFLQRFKRGVYWLCGMGAVILPWLIRNLVLTGNPFYPFLNRIFHWGELSRRMLAVPEYADGIAKVTKSLPDWKRMITLGTFHPFGDFAGYAGVIYLTLLPLMIWMLVKKKQPELRRLLWVILASFAGWGLGPLLVRYEFPMLALLAIPIGISWQMMLEESSGRKKWLPHLGIAVLFALNFIHSLSPIEISRFACVMHQESVQKALEKSVSYWGVVPTINKEIPRDARILLAGESRCYGIKRSLIVEDPFHVPYLKELTESSDSAEAMARRLKSRGITHILFNHHEARRQAVMTGRREYLQFDTEAGKKRFEHFWQGHLTRLFQSGPCEVLLIR